MIIKKLITAILFVLCISSCKNIIQDKNTDNKKLSAIIPKDSTVKIGKLANGLTYYIKHNVKPKNKVELRLVVKAGSILEDETQLGLAHFIEHMAFNGTKKFPKNKLIDHLQSLGVAFGADLNAHTGFDETVYKLSIPSDEKTITTSLQILRDWIDGVAFSPEEIDNERGVVLEELRARNGAGLRMYYKAIPVLTNNSRYAERSPIGKVAIIENANYETIKRFYNDWYRPDLMALVIVGDLNLEGTEKKIKETFKSIKQQKNPKERIYYEIPQNEKPKIAIIKDKETQGAKVSVYFKKQETAIKTLEDYKQVLLGNLYSGMLRQRLDEVTLKPNAPFLKATSGIGDFLANMDCYFLRANLKEDKISEGIEALLTESERAKQFGFTATELERYKTFLLNNARIRTKETGKIASKYYIKQYVNNFTDHTPIPSDEFKYTFYKDIFPTITIEDVNAIANQWVREDNIAIVVNAIDKKDFIIPSENEITQIFEKVSSKEIQPYEDKFSNTKLMSEKPKSGKIISQTYHENLDITVLELENGITVITKPTEFQNDLIAMTGFRPGGSSTAPDSLYVSARFSGNIVNGSGLNSISKTDLKKINMGKTLNVSSKINFYEELFSGFSSSNDLESLFQMTHLYFTNPNKDQRIFETFKENLKSNSKDKDKNPNAYFEKQISKIMTKNHLRAIPLNEAQIENDLNLDDAYNFYKKRFSSANGFTFIYTGSFQIDSLKKFATQYLASLPSDLTKTSSWNDTGLRYAKGNIKKTIVKGINKKSTVDMRFINSHKFSLEDKKKVSLLAKLLKIKLTEEMREKMAGVYGVQVSGFASNKPYDWCRMNIRFTCDPNNVAKLIKKVFEEIDKIKKNGATTEDVNKIKKTELTNAKDALELNKYWLFKLKEAHVNELDFESILDYETDINKIDATLFKDAANVFCDLNNYAQFILVPAKK